MSLKNKLNSICLTNSDKESQLSPCHCCCRQKDVLLDSETKFLVTEEMKEHRLDYFVSRELGISRKFAQTLIKDANVRTIPERRIKPSIKVKVDEEIIITLPPIEELDLEPEDVAFEVIYFDNDIIVINKPAGLVVHPAPGHWTGTLVHGLLFRFPDMGCLNGVKRPGIVHRLDSTTSGLMVIARNGLAQEALFRDFRDRRIYKEYIALCHGIPSAKEGIIKYPIGRDPYNRTRMAITDDGRDAWTDYSVIWSKLNYSLVRCLLHTGRTHQIRVHMASIRCPLVGDRLYCPNKVSSFGSERVFLHAWKLKFKHPRTGEEMSFLQPIPSELSLFLKGIVDKDLSLL